MDLVLENCLTLKSLLNMIMKYETGHQLDVAASLTVCGMLVVQSAGFVVNGCVFFALL